MLCLTLGLPTSSLRGRGLLKKLSSCLGRLLYPKPPLDEFDAAVAVVLASCPDLRVVMIERTLRPEDPWGGDMAFPGGRREDGESPLDTALRELEEETCISAYSIKPLGFMDTVSPKTIRMRVIPLVAIYTGGCPAHVRSCRTPETSRVALVPLPSLLEIDEFMHPSRGIRVYGFKDWYGNIVWGMSLRILVRLKLLVDACMASHTVNQPLGSRQD